MTGITVIIPSVRLSLTATLQSLVGQTTEADTVIAVRDTPEACWVTRNLMNSCNEEYEGTWRCVDSIPDAPLGAYGHAARNHILDRLGVGEWVWSLDDDDVALPDALNELRAAASISSGRWFLFKMVGGKGSHYPGMTVPVPGLEGVLRRGNVGTPMILAPNCGARFGTSVSDGEDDYGRNLGAGYFGDFVYAWMLNGELGPPVWIDRVVAEIRP